MKLENNMIKRIIVTAYNWEDIASEALALGVDGFIRKPLTATDVLEQLAEVANKKKQASNENKPVDLTGSRILLAEDVHINAEIMKQLLSMRGLVMEHAENGQIAIEMFNQSAINYYDAILMDVRMPVKNGLEATREIRALNREDAKNIPIIAMTANAFDEDVQQSLQAGMNAHLSKPVEPAKLFETLTNLIKK